MMASFIYKTWKIALVVAVCMPLFSFSQNLVINEVMYLNDTTHSDQFGNYQAWIELYNRGESDIQLHNYYLSNSQYDPDKWRIPNKVLEGGEFLVVFASANNVLHMEPFHTNFTVVNQRHRVFLFDDNKDQIDATPEWCVPRHRSVARLPDGFEDWEYPSHATPGQTNNTAYADELNEPLVTLDVSHASGYFSQPITIEIDSDENYPLRYTWNTGAAPTWDSPIFSGSLELSPRDGDPNVYSIIPTIKDIGQFEIPEEPINKAHVLRVAAFSAGCPVSGIYTGNYLVTDGFEENRYPGDVVFVNTDPDNLFDSQKGIYVAGEDENFVRRGKEWERPAHVEFFDSTGSYLAQDIGIRIHGGGTREGAQKSLRLYAREKYGPSTFDYPFFEDRDLTEYKRLILRTSMGDWSRTMFKDHLCHSLVRDLNIGYQSGKVAVVFINGEYWGVHNIRERQDKHYLEAHYGVNDDNLDVVEYNLFAGRTIVEEGDLTNYEDLIHYLENNDLRVPQNYLQVEQMIDIPNFIDQHIAQLYFANTDFPENNNTLWRDRTADGVWRWLFYDCDGCMMRPQYNHLHENLSDGQFFEGSPPWSMVIFRALLRNEEFKNQFVTRFRTLLSTAFSAGRVLSAINSFEKRYAPLVPEHIRRWHYPNHFTEWLSNVDGLRGYAMERPIVMSKMLERYFGKPFTLSPNPCSGNFEIRFTGAVQVGHIEMYDSHGKTVLLENHQNTLKSAMYFTTDLPAGIFLMRIEVNGRYFSEKVVVADY